MSEAAGEDAIELGERLGAATARLDEFRGRL